MKTVNLPFYYGCMMNFTLKRVIYTSCLLGIFFLLLFFTFDLTRKKTGKGGLEEEGRNKAAPYEFFEMTRNYPEFYLDINAFNAAVQICKKEIATKNKMNLFSGLWQTEGPTNIGGRVNCIAVCPANNSTILAGSVYGGIFKTNDGGLNWRPVFDSTAYLAVASIVYDTDSANIVYAGTGDPSTSYNAFTGNGIYKSTDGGESWVNLGLNQTGIVANIVIDPTNHQVIYAATMGYLMRRDTNRGLYKSTDGGQTWLNILRPDNETGVMDVKINPSNPNVVYACTMHRIRTNQESLVYGTSTRIYKSTDGGSNWSVLSGGLPAGSWCKVNMELHPTQPDVLFASVADTNLQLKGIYKSTNAGNNWVALNISSIDTNALGGFGWYFGQVRINPYNPNQLFLQGVNLWRSDNGGNTWQLGAPEWYQYIVHSDKHFMHFYSANNYLLATDGGIYQTQNNGTDWTKISFMPITQFYHVAVNYWRPGIYYGGAQDQGTSSGNALGLNSWQRVLGGDGFRPAFSTIDSSVVWASTQNGNIYYSTEGGMNFMDATFGVEETDRKNWDSPYLLSKHNQNAFLGTQYVYKCDDYMNPFFSVLSPDLTDGNIYGKQFHTISALYQSELSADNLFAGTSDGNVWRSLNGGADWANITSGLPNRYVTSFAGSFRNAGLVYVTHSGYRSDDYIPHVHKSIDNGSTWIDISGNLPPFAVNDILTFSYNDSLLAVATDGGVYITTNAGAQWERTGTNMPVFPVFDIEFDSVNYKLIAGTFARSMMSYDMKSFFGINSLRRPSSTILGLYPNPASDYLRTESSLLSSGGLIRIYSMKGEMVLEKHLEASGSTISVKDLKTGLYLVCVRSKETGEEAVRKLVKH